jgi:aspartyl-tRNA(Asn)/glutamyl-tRNA(Gln) amidotransferase subunit A
MKSREGQIMNAQTASRGYHFAGIAEIGEWIRRGDVSPVELLKSFLERIGKLNPQLNAFITVASESALQGAESAAKEIREGKWRGPLHGLPIGIKDFYDTAGIRTTAAFEHFRNRVPGRDAACVEELKKAGAIIIGKTNMHTLGMGTTGLESCFGPVKNPWDAKYIPGGSSSGSAAAVASGLCYATIDTDAIGSCRLPAACCGVVGFKGTYGLIDMNGILAGEKPPDEEIVWMAHAGITARSVEDTAIILNVLAERAARGEESFSGSLRRGGRCASVWPVVAKPMRKFWARFRMRFRKFRLLATPRSKRPCRGSTRLKA